MALDTSMPTRPKQVTIAVLLIGISFLLAAFQIENGNSNNLAVYLSYAVCYFLLWLLCSGKNWVRWLFIVYLGLLLSRLLTPYFISTLQHSSPFVLSIAITRLLFDAVALVLLLLQPSSEWFKTKPAVLKSTPASQV